MLAVGFSSECKQNVIVSQVSFTSGATCTPGEMLGEGMTRSSRAFHLDSPLHRCLQLPRLPLGKGRWPTGAMPVEVTSESLCTAARRPPLPAPRIVAPAFGASCPRGPCNERRESIVGALASVALCALALWGRCAMWCPALRASLSFGKSGQRCQLCLRMALRVSDAVAQPGFAVLEMRPFFSHRWPRLRTTPTVGVVFNLTPVF